MSSLFNVELERHLIACLIKNPEGWGEIADFINPADFSKIHKPFFEVIQFQLNQTPQGSVTPLILSDLINKYSVSLDGISPYEYLLAAQQLIPSNNKELSSFAKELKKITIRRQLIEKCNNAIGELQKATDKSAQEIIDIVDKSLSDINIKYHQSETPDIFSSLIEVVEERGNNPVDASQMGYMGPFESINRTIGSLSYPSSLVCVGARTGNGKSSIGFYYNSFVAEKYEIPVLHLDAGEMTMEDLQMRAVCALSNGRVPLWMVESGEWRKNKEMVQIIRDEVWPRVKKIKMYYQNISNLTPQEFISFIRRFYFNKIGRGNHLLIHWDYIKGVEALGKNNQEYQAVGYMIGALKSLITEQGGITASVWTSVQNNKSGIYTGKTSSQIADSEESFSISDRIIQQATNAFTMRYKVPDELLFECNQFGNVVLKSTKERKLLGKNYQDMLSPVKVKDGKQFKLMKNYFNLENKNFFYEDKGDLKTMVTKMGLEKVKVKEADKEELI